MPFLMNTYVMYQNCLRYEKNPYNTGGGGGTADFIAMVLFGIVVFSIFGVVFNLMLLAPLMRYMIVYVWSRREPTSVLNFFGFKFQSLYLPWVYCGMDMLMGGSIQPALMGIGVGHLYYFLVDVFPGIQGFELIVTPRFCIDFAEWVAPPGSEATGATGARPPPRQAGPAWGRGRTLGTR